MKVQVIGIQRRFGKSKKSGKDYDMCQLHVLREVTAAINENNTLQGFGFQSVEMDADNKLINELNGQKFPFVAEIEFDTQFTEWGKPNSVVVAVKKAS